MSLIHFHTALGGSILRLCRAPSPRAYSWSGVLSFPFIPPRRSILRLCRAPSPKAYARSGVLSFPFIPPQGSILRLWRPLLQGPTHEADSLSFPFIPPRGSILRLWRAPSSRGYSISKTPFFHLNPSHQSLVTKKEKSQLSLTLFRDRVSSREADIGHCFFLPPR